MKLELLITINLSILILINCQIIVQESGPEVETLNGWLQGRWHTARNGRRYASFEGIPYATVNRRYDPPLPPANWSILKDATKPGVPCPQFELKSGQFLDNEKCLFVNVYVPMNAKGLPPQGKLLPVLFYIHGGAFIFGAGSNYGAKYLMSESIILITINYRLGNFGFLSLGQDGDGLMSENNGLRDIIEGLEWTQRNIQKFHGDPTKVTIAGESAGAASVSALILSPAARGLFHKAVAQSGSIFCPWATEPKPIKWAKELALNLNCTNLKNWNPKQVLNCLRSKTVREILKAELTILEKFDIVFVPTIDRKWNRKSTIESILPDTPYNLVTKFQSNSVHVPLIIGYNSHEGLDSAIANLLKKETVEELNKNWDEKISQILVLNKIVENLNKSLEVAGEIKKVCFETNEIVSNETLNKLTNLYSDFLFVYGVRQAAILHAQRQSQVFPYVLTYPGKFSLVNEMGVATQGVAHGDDLQYLFQSTTTPQLWPDFESGTADDNFSKNLIKTWVTFVQSGVPHSWENNWSPIDYKMGQDGTLSWFNLNKNPTMEMESEDHLQKLKFWESVFSQNNHVSCGTGISLTIFNFYVIFYLALLF